MILLKGSNGSGVVCKLVDDTYANGTGRYVGVRLSILWHQKAVVCGKHRSVENGTGAVRWRRARAASVSEWYALKRGSH